MSQFVYQLFFNFDGENGMHNQVSIALYSPGTYTQRMCDMRIVVQLLVD